MRVETKLWMSVLAFAGQQNPVYGKDMQVVWSKRWGESEKEI